MQSVRQRRPYARVAVESDPLMGSSRSRTTSYRTFLVTACALLLVGALVMIILQSVTLSNTIDEKHIGMDLECMMTNTPDSFINSGFSMPPDTIHAVGDHSVVTMVNTAMQIMKKDTLEVIDAREMDDELSIESGGDPHIVWDQSWWHLALTLATRIAAGTRPNSVDLPAPVTTTQTSSPVSPLPLQGRWFWQILLMDVAP